MGLKKLAKKAVKKAASIAEDVVGGNPSPSIEDVGRLYSKYNPISGIRKTRKALRGAEEGITVIQKHKMSKVMGEFHKGTLRSSSGEKVTERKQAMAIALSEAGLSKPKKAEAGMTVTTLLGKPLPEPNPLAGVEHARGNRARDLPVAGEPEKFEPVERAPEVIKAMSGRAILDEAWEELRGLGYNQKS